jgi:AcrR family transcriptional regulator
MTVQERKARERRQREDRIVEVATGLFREEEWDDVTIEQIADRAEIGKGTVYKHFASKDELFAAMYLAHAEHLADELIALEATGDVVDEVVAVLDLLWRHDLADPVLHLKAACQADLTRFRERISPETRSQLARADGRLRDLHVARLQRGMEEGVFLRQPVELALLFAESAFDGVRRQVLRSAVARERGWRARSGACFRHAVESILRGLGCDEERLARLAESAR